MALALMYDLPEMARPRYGGAMRAGNLDRRRPPELKLHAAGEKEDGGWKIFEVWEAFFQDRYSQALRGRGREFSITVLSANVDQIYTND